MSNDTIPRYAQLAGDDLSTMACRIKDFAEALAALVKSAGTTHEALGYAAEAEGAILNMLDKEWADCQHTLTMAHESDYDCSDTRWASREIPSYFYDGLKPISAATFKTRFK